MALYGFIAVVVLRNVIPWTSVNFILGLAGLPLAISGTMGGPRSRRLLPVAALCCLLCCVLPARSILFFTFVISVAAMYEQLRARLSLIPLLIIALMSPVAQYLSVLFSFPLRLLLTRVAGQVMNMAGMDVTVAGNAIVRGAHEYSVDPACMGLKMLLTSLLCALLLMAVMQKRYAKYVSWLWIPSILIIAFLLDVVANLLRILTLVYFDIGAGSAMHQLTGLLYLALYVLMPLALLAGMVVRRFGKPVPMVVADDRQVFTSKIALQHICLAAVLLCAFALRPREGNKQLTAIPAIAGYEAAYYDKDVLRYSNAEALVYIKRTNSIFGAEHNPAMCWLGSGYTFARINEETVGGQKVYTARLVKGKEQLCTAWWYDNGVSATTSQLHWRWDAIKGSKPYFIINVTTATQAALNDKVKEIREKKVFGGVM